MFGGLLGSLVWLGANVAYRSYVREGDWGFKRFAAFCLGFPITLVSAFTVPTTKGLMKSGRRDELGEERRLLLDIKRDRALRDARARASGTADESETGAPGR